MGRTEEMPRTFCERNESLSRYSQVITGRLQHAARTLPAVHVFFTTINNALHGLPTFVGLSQHGKVWHALFDVPTVICDLAS